ncbi:MAG: glycosyl transferase, partial [Leptospira sp.]|nr:glycosyl transferase [Leptospira sp.]
MNIAYYVSGHGFGHISRSYEIIKELTKDNRIKSIHLISLRNSFIRQPNVKLKLRNLSTDVGIHQNNSISLDIDETLAGVRRFQKSKSELLNSEMEFLKSGKIDLIISDSSSFPFTLARKSGIRSLFIGNFTWDFIYQHYEKYDPFFREYASELSEEYSFCTKGLILPFNCPIESIRKKIYVGIVGRKPGKSRIEVRRDLKFSEKFTYLLFAFGAYGLEDDSLRWENVPENLKIVISGYEGFRNSKVFRIPEMNYPDLIGACDFVFTKPGYGIISECIRSSTPIIYTNRGDFPEYEYLVTGIKKYLKSSFISQEELLNMKLTRAIKAITDNPENDSEAVGLNDGIPEILNEI